MGSIQWEKSVPANNDLGAVLASNITLLNHGSNLVFSAFGSNAANMNSEIVYMNSSGDVLAWKSLHGLYRLVQSIVPGRDFQIWGVNPFNASGQQETNTATLITLNGNLEETKKIEGASGDLVPGTVLKLPDQSFLVFGHYRYGRLRYKIGIWHADKSLQSYRTFEPLSRSEQLQDDQRLGVAVPAPGSNTFALATGVFTSDLQPYRPDSSSSS
ncbi:MAG: hypothetical protein ABSG25_07210, partial [Bryobacteraceae bacterium]